MAKKIPQFNIAALKAKFSAKAAGKYLDEYQPHPQRKTLPKNPGPFTEAERGWLLRNVIDALAARPDESPDFKLWAKHGLSRIYFQHDGSWLAYSTTGTAIYGVGLEGTNPKDSIAYGVRTVLGLSKAAKKGATNAGG